MCTSAILPFLNSNQLSKNTNKIREKLKTLDEIIFNLLKIALERGIVFLITNASPGWVEYSSANFLPLTSVILNKIKIYSAKALFSKNYPGDPIQWKMRAYKYVIEKNNINTRIVSNIICFGDSIIDLEAMESLRYIFNSCCTIFFYHNRITNNSFISSSFYIICCLIMYKSNYSIF